VFTLAFIVIALIAVTIIVGIGIFMSHHTAPGPSGPGVLLLYLVD
jgi:L-asparagine transporter-like permease